jgi:hypothetical protein
LDLLLQGTNAIILSSSHPIHISNPTDPIVGILQFSLRTLLSTRHCGASLRIIAHIFVDTYVSFNTFLQFDCITFFVVSARRPPTAADTWSLTPAPSLGTHPATQLSLIDSDACTSATSRAERRPIAITSQPSSFCHFALQGFTCPLHTELPTVLRGQTSANVSFFQDLDARCNTVSAERCMYLPCSKNCLLGLCTD